MERITSTQQAIDVVTNKNTTKFIVITEYRDIKDTTTGEYPIKSKTEIREVNNDKIITESKTNQTVEEKSEEDVKKESNVKWYIVCFCAGFVFAVLIWLIVKCIILYLRWK